MSFSTEWNKIYQDNEQLSSWPWSDLVSFVMRYSPGISEGSKVLELGCGAGANIPFFNTLKCEYFAMEGSEHIVQRLHEKFPGSKRTIVTGDFTKEIVFPFTFDLVVDRSSLTHNSTDSIKKALQLVFSKLRSGGKFIGIDWFSTEHSDFTMPAAIVDTYTKKDFEQGQFKHAGCVHFSDKEHLLSLFADFKVEVLEHKTVSKVLPGTGTFASWNIVASKN